MYLLTRCSSVVLPQHPAQQHRDDPHRQDADHQRHHRSQQRPHGDDPQMQGRQIQLFIQCIIHDWHLPEEFFLIIPHIRLIDKSPCLTENL